MFFCEPCRELRDWPESPLSRSYGRCEICDQVATCWDVPSSALHPTTKVQRFIDQSGKKAQ